MDESVHSVNNTETFCILQSKLFAPPEGEVWCNWAWDSVLCWPPTKAFSSTKLRCPHLNGIDTRKFVEKYCDNNGRWEGCCESDNVNQSIVWTNYTSCYTSEMLMIIRKLFTGDENNAQLKLDIAAHTRTLEFIGLSISLLSILVSLVIFCRFRSLRNTRTRIHKNLFVAMMIQIVVRLTLYIDQALVKTQNQLSLKGIQNTPFLCEISYILLEYARTAVFLWMFIEGLFLNNVVSAARVFKENSYYRLYRIVGWGCPVIMTVMWAIVTALYFHPFKCWWGYSLSLYFWILEGPRITVILFNFLFLLNIIRALVGKLRQSHTSEIEQARKAVRATLVLLPLLGITNLISMIEAPLDKTLWEFALWSYTTHFLKSFQGLFISTIYCFLNGEVRIAIDKTISTYMLAREMDNHTRRQSSISGNNPHKEISDVDEEESRTSGWSTFLCKGDGSATPERPNEYVLYA